MKVAIVHDWLTGMRGGEKCLEIFCELFPNATLFTLLYNKGSVSYSIAKMKIRTSFIQNLPRANTKYRNYLPLFPKAIESFNLKEFDLILSSSHCVAKGAKKSQRALHLCYCYTPMRYVWMFFDQYFGSYNLWKRKLVASICEHLKKWDLSTLDRVDQFVAISETIKERIKNIYKRESEVIYPPVDVDNFYLNPKVTREDFYICVSSLVPYKRIDVIIEAFNQLRDKKIVIVGDGHLREELEKKKKSENIKFLGWVNENDLVSLYQRARGFIYMAEEDFGIAPVEAQAAGLVVIAYGKGGVAETVIPLNGSLRNNCPTGLFFFEQNAQNLIEIVGEFEKRQKEFSPLRIRENALRFSKDNFRANIRTFIEGKVGRFSYAS
jgi:glycosyltransferase involved in cell wall biosynthesis